MFLDAFPSDFRPTYQWYLSDGLYAPTTAIPGATRGDYVALPSDLGKWLTVEVRGIVYNTNLVERASTGPVLIGTIRSATTCSIAGVLQAGSTVAPASGAHVPVGATVTTTWSSGYVGETYLLPDALVGTTLSYTTVITAPGYEKFTRVCKLAGIVAAGPVVATPTAPPAVPELTFAPRPPRIVGTARSGKTLTASFENWAPKPRYSYTWYANGKAIPHATKSSLKLTKKLVGKRISVKVTGTKHGYATMSTTSKQTKKVAQKR